MAKSFPNIDKSGFRRGEYVGYSAGGKVWKITKANPNGSRAKWLAQTGRQFLYAETLGEVSEKLSGLSDAAGESFPNIDKSGFRRGEYVGYGGRHVWCITNGMSAGWLAQTVGGQCFYRPTLAEVSKELLRLDNTATVTNC